MGHTVVRVDVDRQKVDEIRPAVVRSWSHDSSSSPPAD
jgi:hypothetical protein